MIRDYGYDADFYDPGANIRHITAAFIYASKEACKDGLKKERPSSPLARTLKTALTSSTSFLRSIINRVKQEPYWKWWGPNDRKARRGWVIVLPCWVI